MKGILSSIDFYKRIFLHVIFDRNIFPWEYPILELARSSLIQWIFSVGGERIVLVDRIGMRQYFYFLYKFLRIIS